MSGENDGQIDWTALSTEWSHKHERTPREQRRKREQPEPLSNGLATVPNLPRRGAKQNDFEYHSTVIYSSTVLLMANSISSAGRAFEYARSYKRMFRFSGVLQRADLDADTANSALEELDVALYEVEEYSVFAGDMAAFKEELFERIDESLGAIDEAIEATFV